jgi:hypothetical protein
MTGRDMAFLMGGAVLVATAGAGFALFQDSGPLWSRGPERAEPAAASEAPSPEIESLRSEIASLRARLRSLESAREGGAEPAGAPSPAAAPAEVAGSGSDGEPITAARLLANPSILEDALFGNGGVLATLSEPSRASFMRFLREEGERRRAEDEERERAQRERELDCVLSDAQRSGLGEVLGRFDAVNEDLREQSRALLQEGGSLTPEYREAFGRLREARREAVAERDAAIGRLLGDEGLGAYRRFQRESAQRRNQLLQFLRGGDGRPRPGGRVEGQRPDRTARASRRENGERSGEQRERR